MRAMRRNFLAAVSVAALLLLPAGCAKGPSGSPTGGGGGLTGTLLVVTMTVRGTIDPVHDYYFILFNDNRTARNGFTGPVPVVTDFERGGNGFAGGNFSHYVEVHQNAGPPSASGNTNFGLYSITPDLLTPSTPGALIQAQISTTNVSNDTLTFEIPLASLATSDISVSSISNLEINFISTDIVPVNPQDTSPKNFDALGDATAGGQLNAFATIFVGTNATGQDALNDVATYSPATNSPTTLPYTLSANQSSSAIANLDITNWSVTFSN